MASVTTVPSPAQIAAQVAEIYGRPQPTRKVRRKRLPELSAVAEVMVVATNSILRQSDEIEPADLDDRDPRQTEQWLPVPAIDDDRYTIVEADDEALNASHVKTKTVNGKVPVPVGGPVEMSAADRCGFDVGSVRELNSILSEERWTVGDVSLEDYEDANMVLADENPNMAKLLPLLKTEGPKPAPLLKSDTAWSTPARWAR